MTVSLKHRFHSAIPDAGDPTIVQPSNWNDEHDLIQTTGRILGRVSVGDGATEELTPAQARTLLNVADGATANSSDAFLLARANHTGTQLAATISDFSTAADARISAAIGVTVQAYDADLASWAGVTRAAGFDTFAVTPSSANLRSLLTDETGTGAAYFQGGDLGTPSAGVLTNATGLPVGSGISGLASGIAAFLAAPSSANLRAALTDEVGTGASYFVGGALGTPASGVATNLTGLPLTTGVTGQLPIANGGHGQSTAGGGFDALAPTTTRGDLIFRNATTNARLAASTSGYLLQTNGAGTDPTWVGFVQPVGSSPSTRTWQSKASDCVSILDFGAIGDGNVANAATNATALTNALATGKKVIIPYTSSGYHFGTNQIAVGSGQVIEGESQVLLKSTATTSLFRMTGFELTSGVHNVSIDMTGSGASSTAIRFGTNSGASIFRVRISRVKFSNCVEAIGDESHATNYVVDVIIDDCMAWMTRGRQIYIRRSRGFMLIRSTNVDFTSDSGLVAWEGIRLEDFAGLELERVDVVGWGTGVRAYNAALYGIVISNGAALWLTRVFVDSFLGNGISISTATFVFSNALETSLVNGLGIVLATVSKGVFENTLINGGTGVTGAAASAQGLYLDTVTDCTFTTTLAYNCTGTGIAAVTANNRVTFMGVVSSTNLFGLAIQGTSAKVQFIGGSLTGNGTPVSDTATGGSNVIKDIAGYNGHASFVTVQGSTVALSNSSTSAQNIFAAANDVLTVEAATTYRFRARLSFNTGATSHTTAFGFGGTATFTSCNYASRATSSAAATLATPQMLRVAVATATVLTAASTAVTTDIVLEGIIRINAAGTIIPQVTFSAGPTGTCETAIDSFFELQAIGPNTIAAGDGWA